MAGVAAATIGSAVLMLGGGATSAVAADNCANAEFRVGPSALLPDCRAYELVTRADKAAYTMTAPGNPLAFPSESGEQAAYSLVTPLPDAHNAHISVYVAARESGGWKTRPMTPEICKPDQSGFPGNGSSWGLGQASWSLDLSVTLLEAAATNNCDPADHAGGDVYRFDGSNLTWLSHNGAPKTVDVPSTWVANNADASHVVFRTAERLIMPLESGRLQGPGLYERVGDHLRAVGLKSDGSVINPCGARIAGVESSSAWDTLGRVSDDGRVILFHSVVGSVAGCSATTDDAGQLYARLDGSRTVMLSASQRTAPDTRRQPDLMGATRDGRLVFFRSTEMLTDDATTGGGLYVYDLGPVLDGIANTGTLRFLTKTLTAAAANVQGTNLAGMSQDGSVVFFVASGVLDPVAPTSGSKLYAYSHGQVRLVTALSNFSSNASPAKAFSVSEDGSKATGVYRPAGYTTDQVFLYDGSSVTCVSCVAGVTSTGHAALQERLTRPASLGPRRNVTNDGMVFFESVDRLVARDANDRRDVYRYADGELRLISSGTGTNDTFLAGVSASGRDVFLVTNDSLAPEDFDNGDQDMYVARVGGGFPQPPAAEPCAGDACQGTAPGVPGAHLPGSSVFTGSGNLLAPTESGDASASKLTLLKDSRSVRGTSARVRVRVSGKGRVRTSGSGVRQSTRNVSRAGTTYRVPVRLSTRAKRTLNRRGRVRVRVAVRFTPADGMRRTTRVRMTFRKATKSKSRSKATMPKSRAGERTVFAASNSREKGGR